MVRPTNKDGLLLLSQSNYEKLTSLIDSIPLEKQLGAFPFEDRDRNIRDVLIHLYEWHQLYLNWTEYNTTNKEIFPFIPAPYNWKTYPLMNIEFWKKHQTTDFNVAQKMLAQSHYQVMKRISQFSNEELYIKKYFPWTGSTHLASASISATSSHYDWASNKIKKYKKLMIL